MGVIIYSVWGLKKSEKEYDGVYVGNIEEFSSRNKTYPDGRYTFTGHGELDYQTPYSYYNRLRSCISRGVFGVNPETVWSNPLPYADEGAFLLVNFADNEGSIDAKNAKEIFESLKKHNGKILAEIEDEGMRSRYEILKRVFEEASQNNGLVIYT